MRSSRTRGIAAALLAALTFGLTVPLAKAWFSGVGPWLLAGLLYLGSGIGLSVWALLRGRPWSVPRHDLPWLAGSVLAGGIVAPVLLLLGLRDVPASTASLMLTCEGLFTSLLAWIAFREHYDGRIVLGFLAIAGGAVTLALVPGSPQSAPLVPAVLILAACLAWGVDNNLTRVIALADPIQIAAAKGLVAGLTNTILALSLGAQFPTVAGAVIAGALMGWGVWLHVTEHHLHDHEHDSIEHEHAHEHDDHHDHQHCEGLPPGSHTHRHTHQRLRHQHPHFPDAHHRHDH